MALVLTAVALTFVGAGDARADVDPSRYNSIVERNPFALKPPPPPPDPAANQPPPPPVQLATVKLTGITSILSSRKACLEIIPGPGKQMLKPILSEGEKIETVEVVTIDVDKNEVIIKNGPVTTNLTFEVVKSSGPAPAGGAPAGVVPPVVPGGIAPTAAAPPAFNYSQPTSAGRSGVMMAGGSTYQQPPAGNVNPASLGLSGGLAPNVGAPAVPGSATGFRSIPSRTIRQSTLSPEAAQIDMEGKRVQNPGIPYPPTLLSPRAPKLPPLPGQSQEQ